MSAGETVDGGALELVAVESDAGTRLDVFLAASVPGLSRTRARQALDDGDVLVDGALAKASRRLKGGERIEIELPAPPETRLVPEPIPFDVVFEDKHFVVVNKPAGLVVHPGAGVASGTLANGLVYRFGAGGGGPTWRPGIVHRIDKDTSGLLVVARTETAHASLSEQFAARTVTKSYLAMVYGRVDGSHGRFDRPIGRHPRVRVRMAVVGQGRGRPALTLYDVRERFESMTFVEVDIRTGRTHQIRVHFADAGHPVVGDEVYGQGRSASLRDRDLRRRVEALGRHFLHAATLEFAHPATGERLTFTSPLPPELQHFLEYCRERAR